MPENKNKKIWFLSPYFIETMKTLDTYKQLENSLTQTHLFYFQEFNKTKWDTKRACWRIFNNTATALKKAKKQAKDWDMIKAVETILKSYERIDKIQSDFWLTY